MRRCLSLRTVLIYTALFTSSTNAAALPMDHQTHAALADSHAPSGVSGDHLHHAGEWMISYRSMRMHMSGNRKEGHTISAEDIVTTSPALRVVPTDMTSQGHMLSFMYAPSDDFTVMAMLSYLEKSMDHISFSGMSGTTELGRFRTSSRGMGDTKISALYRLYNQTTHQLHLNFGLSLPTGKLDAEDNVLTPMNTRPTLRLPYAMQLGSGTYDLMPGVTYRGYHGQYSWGGQFNATVRLGENDEGYTLGDNLQFTGWASYRVQPAVSFSIRLDFKSVDEISGRDDLINAPVQTANPDNYGGEFAHVGIGINLAGQTRKWRGHRLSLEWLTPVEQNGHGLQMDHQSMWVTSYQYAF